jgi:hypothetical protein
MCCIPIVFRFLAWKTEFSLFPSGLPALEPAQHRIQWRTRFRSSGVRWPGMKLESHPHLVPLGCSCTPTPPYAFMAFKRTTFLSNSFTLAGNTFTKK